MANKRQYDDDDDDAEFAPSLPDAVETAPPLPIEHPAPLPPVEHPYGSSLAGHRQKASLDAARAPKA